MARETIKSFSKEIAKIGMKEVIKAGPKQVLKTVAGLLHFSYISGILKGRDPVFYGAPVVIFISAPKDNEWAALDIGMCCQNMSFNFEYNGCFEGHFFGVSNCQTINFLFPFQFAFMT